MEGQSGHDCRFRFRVTDLKKISPGFCGFATKSNITVNPFIQFTLGTRGQGTVCSIMPGMFVRWVYLTRLRYTNNIIVPKSWLF